MTRNGRYSHYNRKAMSATPGRIMLIKVKPGDNVDDVRNNISNACILQRSPGMFATRKVSPSTVAVCRLF